MSRKNSKTIDKDLAAGLKESFAIRSADPKLEGAAVPRKGKTLKGENGTTTVVDDEDEDDSDDISKECGDFFDDSMLFAPPTDAKLAELAAASEEPPPEEQEPEVESEPSEFGDYHDYLRNWYAPPEYLAVDEEVEEVAGWPDASLDLVLPLLLEGSYLYSAEIALLAMTGNQWSPLRIAPPPPAFSPPPREGEPEPTLPKRTSRGHGLPFAAAASVLVARHTFDRDLRALASQMAPKKPRPTPKMLRMCEQMFFAVQAERDRRDDEIYETMMSEDRSHLRRQRAKELQQTIDGLEAALANGDAAKLKSGVAEAEALVAELHDVSAEDVDELLAKFGREPGKRKSVKLEPLQEYPQPALEEESNEPLSPLSTGGLGTYKLGVTTAPPLRRRRRPANLGAITEETGKVQEELDLLIKEIHFPTPERRGSKLSHRRGSKVGLLMAKKAGVPRTKRKKRAATPEEPVMDSALRELPPAQALRMGLLLKLGSMRSAWRLLDSNGSGSLSYTEFVDGIERTKVPWKEITGLTRLKDLFNLFDVDGDKEVSLVEFLGFPDVDDEPPSAKKGPVPTSTMWKKYINNVKLSPMTCSRQSKWKTMAPLQYQLEVEHHPAELEKIAEMARKPDDEIAQLKRVHVNEIEDKGRRITEKLKVLNSYTEAFRACKSDLTDVTIGSKKDREEAEELEKLEAAKKKFKGMTSVAVDDPQRKLMREATEATKKLEGDGVAHKSKPPDDLIHDYFNEKHLEEDEREFRDLTRRYEIPMWDACKIREYFQTYDADGSGAIDREEFALVVRDMLCIGKAKNVEIPETVVDQYFNSADKRRCGEVTFENFLVWSFRNGVFANRGK